MSEFIKRYKELGFEYKEIQLKQCIRVNTLKISSEELIERLKKRKMKLEKVPFLDNGYFVRGKFSIGATPEYLLGLYYIQESASQLPVQILQPKGLTLDCCAAPGGKTTQIAEKTPVVALESNYNRANVLLNNIERMGVSNSIVYNLDARMFEGGFDTILVDAPCSGNYVTDKNWLEKQSVKNFDQRAKLQKEILTQAFVNLKSRGELVYSTCSLEPEENEFIVDWVLENFEDVEILPIDIKIGVPGLINPFGKELNEKVKHARRIWPGETQGFFIAKFKKK